MPLSLYLNDCKEINKNMSRAQIVMAIDHLVASGVSLANEIHTLNHWR